MTLVGIFTIFVSSYYIVHSERLYVFLKPVIKRFEFRKKLVDEMPPETTLSDHIVLIGAHHMGGSILEALDKSGGEYVVVDFDPELVRSLNERGIPVIYGDAADPDIHEKAQFSKAKVVISTIPTLRDNLGIINAARSKRKSKKTRVVVTAGNPWHARELYKEGADYVLTPHLIGGRELADVIYKNKGLRRLDTMRARDRKILGI